MLKTISLITAGTSTILEQDKVSANVLFESANSHTKKHGQDINRIFPIEDQFTQDFQKNIVEWQTVTPRT